METKKIKLAKPHDMHEIGMVLLKARTFIALIVLIVVFALLEPKFISLDNITMVSKHVARYAILAIGMTYVIVSGGIDLSVGSVAGLSGMIAGGLISKGLVLTELNVSVYFHVALVVLIALLVGAIVGLINGLIISKLNVPAFITTLGTMYIARGAALLINGGATFPNLIGNEAYSNTGFPYLGSGTIFGIPVIICFLIVLVLLSIYMLKKTPLGWHVYATGGNEKAAKLSGINVDKTKLFVYIFSAICAASTGIFAASELEAAHPATGETWEMNAIAATVLGGTSMSGGLGTIGGAIVGSFVIGVLNDGMIMLGLSSFWQMVIKGVVIIIAVVIDQMQREFQAKLALSRKE